MEMSGELKPKQRYVIHPTKFALWLFIVSIILFFGGITSAFIVSRGIEMDQKLWHEFELPSVFWYTTAVIMVSSIMLQIGIWGARKGDFNRAKIALVLTFILGIFFLVGQVFAWRILYENDIRWAEGNADSYLYLITFLHAAHIIAGLFYLTIVMIKTVQNKYTADNLVGMENCATFWHFLDLLWIYLFIFLLLNH